MLGIVFIPHVYIYISGMIKKPHIPIHACSDYVIPTENISCILVCHTNSSSTNPRRFPFRHRATPSHHPYSSISRFSLTKTIQRTCGYPSGFHWFSQVSRHPFTGNHTRPSPLSAAACARFRPATCALLWTSCSSSSVALRGARMRSCRAKGSSPGGKNT